MTKYKLKHTAIKRPKRIAIRYERNTEGLYEGMKGTVTHNGRTFRLPTPSEEHSHLVAVRRRMYICFGTQNRLNREEVKELKQERLDYLELYRKTINVKNQNLTTKEERNALLPSKSDVGCVQSKTPRHSGKSDQQSKTKLHSKRKYYVRRRKT